MAQSEKVHVDSPGIQTQPEPGRASSPHDNGCGDGYSSDSQRSLIGDEFSANESSQLIPSSGEPTIETLQDPSLSRSGPASGDTTERRGSSLYLVGDATASGIQPCSGPAPVCTSPSSCSNKTRLGSTSSVYTRTSYKSASSQLPPPAGEDCCLHCLLACLFCELLVFCDLLLECGPHGAGSELSCPGPACGDTDDGCPCSMECSLLEDCCSSADCLEICLECCSICFAA